MFSPRHYFEVFATTMLLVGLPQSDGSYTVHYKSLGLRMATYSEWQQQGMEAVIFR